MTQLAEPIARADSMPAIGEAIGTPEAASLVAYIYDRREAVVKSLSSAIQIAKACRQIVTWGDEIDDASAAVNFRTLVNKIKIACETQVANHLKEPAKVTVAGVETGEYAKWYWCGPPEAAAEVPILQPTMDPMSGQQGMQQVGAGLDPMFVGAVTPMGDIIEPLPLPTPMVKYLQSLVQQGLVEPNYFCKLNDEFTAKTIQKQFDQDWDEAGGDEWLRETVWATIIEGWQLPLYEFDQRTYQHILGDNSIEQTYPDQSRSRIRNANEAGIDLYLDMDEALAKYPDQRDAIMDADERGNLTSPGTGGRVPVQFKGDFHRPMLTKVVWWMKNRPCGIKAAMEAGLVEQRNVIAEVSGQQTNGLLSPDGRQDVDSPSSVQSVAELSSPSDSTANAGAGQPGSVDEAMGAPEGAPAIDDGLGQTTVRTAYFLPNTQTEVTPGSPQWPTAIHQCSIIADELVEDIVCPYPEINLLHMRNSLVIGRPWGVGEPFNTKNLQRAYSGITDDAVRHAHACAFPTTEMPDDLKQFLEKEVGQAFVQPDQVIGVPNDMWDKTQPTIRTINPPAFPASSVQIREMIGSDFNDVAGRPDVLAGNSPSPTDSGRKVQQLTMNAVEPLNFRAQEIGFMLERLAKLMIYSRWKHTPIARISDAVSVPVPLLSLIAKRVLSKTPNVKAIVSTGAGSALERKRQQALQLNQMVDPATRMPLLDAQSTRELMGQDAQQIDRRNQQGVKDAAMLTAQTMPQQPEEGGEPAHSSNGNGRMH